MKWIKDNFLTSNALKVIACISMFIDHLGYYIFPEILIFRIIGRLAFPIFAYFIAKGCIYTKNKTKRLTLILALGLLCELFMQSGNVLLTFSLSIVLIYAYKFIIDSFKENKSLCYRLISICIFFCSLGGVYFLNSVYPLDYGYFGILFPLVIYVGSISAYGFTNKRIEKYIDMLILFINITILAFLRSDLIVFSYLTIPFIACYNHKKGNLNLKYLFYILYPIHILLFYIISLFI